PHPPGPVGDFPSIMIPLLGPQPWRPPTPPQSLWEAVPARDALFEVEFLTSAYQELCHALNSQDLARPSRDRATGSQDHPRYQQEQGESLAWYRLHLMAQQLATRHGEE